MSCRVFRLFRGCRSHMLGQMYYQICCLPSSFGCLGVWNHAFSPLFQCVGLDVMNIWQWAERISKFPTQVTTQRHWRLQGPHDDRSFSFFSIYTSVAFDQLIFPRWGAELPKVRHHNGPDYHREFCPSGALKAIISVYGLSTICIICSAYGLVKHIYMHMHMHMYIISICILIWPWLNMYMHMYSYFIRPNSCNGQRKDILYFDIFWASFVLSVSLVQKIVLFGALPRAENSALDRAFWCSPSCKKMCSKSCSLLQLLGLCQYCICISIFYMYMYTYTYYAYNS